MKIKLTKGLDLDLAGKVTDKSITEVAAVRCAIIPDDFHGFVPKLDVKEGDMVKVGDPILHEKTAEQMKIVSPICGRVAEVVRGERRKIERIVVEYIPTAATDKPEQSDRLSTVSSTPECRSFNVTDIDTRDKAIALLCESGMLARIRRRPYDVVVRPTDTPRDIFITAIDKAPLSPGFILPDDCTKHLVAGVALLKKVTDGKVYLSVAPDWKHGNVEGTEMVEVEGRHPAGNVGVQIANIAPVNKGEVVWGLDVVTLYKIGALMLTGTVDTSTVVAITGSEVERPCLLATREGAAIQPLLVGNLKLSDHHVRIISGNVLTGVKVPGDGFLRFPYRQITVIPEGDDVAEFMGWASLAPSKMSTSPTFPGHFFGHDFKPDARLLGGRRAMIMSGEYDKVLPMDIMTEYLLKAIIGGDIEAMEDLGIYEIAPEDVALCEYVDTSKMPLQQIVRDGLDKLRKELE